MKAKNLLTNWVMITVTAFLFNASAFAQTVPSTSIGYSLNGCIYDSTGNCDSIAPMYVYDRFGNKKLLEEITVSQNSYVAGFFRIHFQDEETSNGIGFDDQNAGTFFATIGQDRREVVIQVFEDLSVLLGGVLPNPYPNEPSPCASPSDPFPLCRVVEINVRASAALGGAGASANQWHLDIGTGITYGNVWEYINTGYDPYFNLSNPPLAPAPAYHGFMTVDFVSGFTWNTNLNAGAGVGELDLYSGILHEVLHMLGMGSAISFDGTSSYIPGAGIGTAGRYNLWDNFLQTTGGVSLLNFDLDAGCYDPQFNTATLGSLTATCSGVNFVGPGNTPNHPITTTPSFNPATSLSHFNCSNVVGFALNPGISTNSTQRFPNIVEAQALCALGYNVSGTYGNGDYGISTHIYGGTTCSISRIVSGTNDFKQYKLDNTCSAFTVESGQPIDFIDFTTNTNACNDNSILDNDNGAVAISCLEVVIGGTTADNLSNFTLPTTTSFTYTPPILFVGQALIKYRPVNANNERGNITYIFINVTAPPLAVCVGTGLCGENILCYGSFEELTPAGINGASGLAPLFDFTCTDIVQELNNKAHLWSTAGPNIVFNVSCGTGTMLDAVDGDLVVGFWEEVGGATFDPVIFFPLSRPIEQNHTYNISYFAYVLNNANCIVDLDINLSEQYPCVPPNHTFNLSPCDITPPCDTYAPLLIWDDEAVTTQTWTQHSLIYTHAGNDMNFLLLSMDGVALDSYVFIDNVSVVEEELELGVTSVVSNNAPCVNDNITITYTICNNGIITNIDDIGLLANVPSGLNIVANADFNINGEATIAAGTLAPSNCVDRILELNVDPGAIPGSPIPVELTTVPGACIDGIQVIDDIIPGIDGILTISKNVSQNIIYNAGDPIVYEITICNTQAQAVTGIIVEDILPTELIFNSGLTIDFTDISGTLTSNPFDLAGGQCTTLEIFADIDGTVPNCTNINNCATVVSGNGLCNTIDDCFDITLGGLDAIISASTDESCSGACDGEATVTVTGGTSPFVYSWDDPLLQNTSTAVNLCAGIYNVTVTDANLCEATASVTINDPGIPCVSNCNVSFWLDGTSVVNLIPPCDGVSPAPPPPSVWIASPCPGSNYGYVIFIYNPSGSETWNVNTTIDIQLDNMFYLNTVYSTCNFTTTTVPGSSSVQYVLNSPIPGGTFCQIGMTTQNITIPGSGLWNTTATMNINCADGSTPSFNTSLQEGPDTCSCDPNEKQVSPAGCGELGFITNQELTYTLLFQNLGTGPAHDIVLRDTIDNDLDLNSIQILASSHTITNTQINLADREFVITFQGIELPAEQDDSPGSNGFVAYSIMPFPGLPEGTTITNSTGIFFNGLPPVITNTVINTIVNDPVVTVDAGQDQIVFFGYDPEACVTLTATATGALPPYSFEWSTGETTQTIIVCPEGTTNYTVIANASRCLSAPDTVTVNVVDVHCGNNNKKVQICHIPPGNPDNPQTLCISSNAVPAHLTNHGDYLGLCVVDSSLFDSLNLQVQFSNVFLTAYPNPFSQKTIITFSLPEPGNVILEVFYLNSLDVVKLFEGYAEANILYPVEFNTIDLSPGIYFYRLVTDTETYNKKLVLIND
ncbi:MAG: T9SS type A sorting domain-containing protein [Cytophagales bacterium]|nr:T9SS type A sorting domain-containing protein [Cytophagales bacterium]